MRFSKPMFRAVVGMHLLSVQSRQVHSLPGPTDEVVPEAPSRARMCPNSSGSSVEQQDLNLGAGH